MATDKMQIDLKKIALFSLFMSGSLFCNNNILLSQPAESEAKNYTPNENLIYSNIHFINKDYSVNVKGIISHNGSQYKFYYKEFENNKFKIHFDGSKTDLDRSGIEIFGERHIKLKDEDIKVGFHPKEDWSIGSVSILFPKKDNIMQDKIIIYPYSADSQGSKSDSGNAISSGNANGTGSKSDSGNAISSGNASGLGSAISSGNANGTGSKSGSGNAISSGNASGLGSASVKVSAEDSKSFSPVSSPIKEDQNAHHYEWINLIPAILAYGQTDKQTQDALTDTQKTDYVSEIDSDKNGIYMKSLNGPIYKQTQDDLTYTLKEDYKLEVYLSKNIINMKSSNILLRDQIFELIKNGQSCELRNLRCLLAKNKITWDQLYNFLKKKYG